MATIKQIKDTEGNVHDILSTIGYGTCATAAATAAKVATISDTSWTLKVGSIIGIKYTYSNRAGSSTTPVTLNVNSTGAKNIWYNNAKFTGTNTNICGYANRVTYYMYDGTYWVWLNTGALDGNSDEKTSSSNKTGTKLYLVGATTQSTSGQTTYTNSNCYVGTDNCLYSGGKKVLVDGNEQPMLSVNYSELVNLRDNGQLIPGQQYRITNYVTTVSQALNEISAGHKFDIIVTADSENILNEEARAIQNVNDTHFNNSNLSDWKIWYSLDNDEDRFNWANEEGYGVIYRMIDEYGNDCPYDFKNIQFKVDGKYFYTFTFVESEDLSGLVYDISCKHSGSSGDVYNNVINRYIINNIQYLNGITFISNVYYVVDGENSVYRFGYNFYNNTFGEGCYNNTFFNDCYNNKFGNDCYNNKLGNSFKLNTFGDVCYSNTFSNECYSNTFSNECSSNTFGNKCYNNTFYNGCSSNTFIDNCYNNTFGNGCRFNALGNNFYNNTFGNYCQSNTFIFNCHSNTFSNECSSNAFGNGCYYNTFGIDCESNTFGNTCSSNTFGNNCYNNTFGNNCQSNTFGNWCGKSTLDGTTFQGNEFMEGCKYNLFGDYCRENKFYNNCSNNTFGANCYYNKFGNDCINNTFDTKCYNNIFGTVNSNNEFDSNAGSCSRNKFGTNCYNNKLFNSCNNNSFDIDCHDNEFGASCTYNKFDTLCAAIKFGSNCSYNTLGNGCTNITFGTSSAIRSYYRRIIIDSGNRYIYLNCGTSGSSKYYQNVRIGLGVNNISTYKTIADGNINQTFETYYKPSESQTILI